MAKQNNTNFRLGLNRQELIEAAQLFGKSEKSAKKSNTKRLEQFITTKLGGKGTKTPTFNDMQKRDIRDAVKTYGIQEALHMTSDRIRRITGNQDESNYLRLTIAREFSSYYDKGVTSNHIDELISRLPLGSRSELISGVRKHEPYYQNIFLDYVEELEEEEENKKTKAS